MACVLHSEMDGRSGRKMEELMMRMNTIGIVLAVLSLIAMFVMLSCDEMSATLLVASGLCSIVCSVVALIFADGH